MARSIQRMAGDEPYRRLADAIILQACDDYRNNYKKISLGELKPSENGMITDALLFFGSSWYLELTGIDSDYLVPKLRADVVDRARADYRKAWEKVWKKGKPDKVYDVIALERFFESDQFRKLTNLSGRRIIAKEKDKVLTRLMVRFRELARKKREGKVTAERELGRIEDFMRSKDFARLSDFDPEFLIRKLEH